MAIHQKQPKGFTLLELLLVFAVIAGIVLASYHRYKQYILDKDLAAIRTNVSILMESLNEYYNILLVTKCPPHAPPSCLGCKESCPTYQHKAIFIGNEEIPVKYWPKEPLLASNLVADKKLQKSTTDYNVSMSEGIETKAPPNYPYFPGEPYYTHQLIVTVTLDSKVVDQGSMDWYLQQLGASSVKGYKLQWIQMPSYTVKGINSNLWMMEGGLATFKKALEGTASS